MRGPNRSFRRRAVLVAILLVAIMALAGALPTLAAPEARHPTPVSENLLPEVDSPRNSQIRSVPAPESVSSAGSTIETLLPNYNSSLNGDFPSTVYDWQIGAPAIVPKTGTLWLPELPVATDGPPAPVGAPALVYNVSTNSFEGIVPALSNASAFAYDSGNGYLYATDPATNSVEVFDPLTQTVVAPDITVGSHPWAIACDPESQYIYVANLGSNNVTVINALTYHVVAKNLPVGKSPAALAIDPTANLVYVVNRNSSYLSVLDAKNLTSSEPRVPLALGNAFGLAYSALNETIAVTFPQSHYMTIVNASDEAVETSLVPVGLGGAGVVATSDGSTFVVANETGNELSFVSAILPYSVSKTTIAVGPAPSELVAEVNDTDIFAWSSLARNLSVVNVSSAEVVATSPTLGSRPDFLAVSPSTGSIFTGDRSLPVIDDLNVTSGRSILRPIPLLSPPTALVSEPTTGILFLGLAGSVIEYSEVTGRALVANDLLSGPNGPILADPSDGILWVARSGAGEVTGLKITNLHPIKVRANLSVDPEFPQAMVLDPETSDIFAVNSSSGDVTVFAAATGDLIAQSIVVGSNVTALGYDSLDGLVYAVGDELTAIDPTLMTTVGSPLGLPSHSGVSGLTFDSSRGLVYVSMTSATTGLGTICVIDGASKVGLSGTVDTIQDGLGPVDLTTYAPQNPDLNGSDIILSANSRSGTIGVIGAPPSISSFAFEPSSVDVGQSTQAVVIAMGGAGDSTVTYSGLPSGCVTKDVFVLNCVPNANGTVGVHVTVTDSIGQSAIAEAFLNVGSAIGLSASFGTLPIPEADVGIPFYASASATGGTPPIEFSWNFGDGNSVVGSSVSHRFSATGTYPVTVSATDSVGAYSVESASVHVVPLPSVAPYALRGSTTDVNLNVRLFGGESGGTMPGSGAWNFGPAETASGVNVSHVWTKPGLHSANFSFEDASHVFANDTLTLLVEPTLTPTFTAIPSTSSPVAGTVFNFTAAIQGGTPPFTTIWSFGGGSYATGAEVSMSFPTAGTHTVGVQVVDGAGASENSSVIVNVGSPSASAPSPFGGNFVPGVTLGLFVGASIAALILFTVERTRRRTLPPPSPYVPPHSLPGPGKRN